MKLPEKYFSTLKICFAFCFFIKIGVHYCQGVKSEAKIEDRPGWLEGSLLGAKSLLQALLAIQSAALFRYLEIKLNKIEVKHGRKQT